MTDTSPARDINPACIRYYHAHLYYEDTAGLAAARQLAEAAAARFELRVGRFHEKPVGPHPKWSCQLSFAPEHFGKIVPWLALNRGELDIFVHLGTDDDLFDHTQGVIWLGHSHPLDLSGFTADT
ncbi:DOPA 4,5-dioxygenase family protein [Halomonas elongata]|uniref:DOPA 4,5-dioxygenase family protein n=1 Tax=Halomonas elongata TaxID=2746 RepID=UPI00255A8371|nr:DOPA 4,5-dioxygenase family protein [Halomonas elongata]MDL4862772.1 DOPA 4,5-dioxygenase family protein [Halomonas elongata]